MAAKLLTTLALLAGSAHAATPANCSAEVTSEALAVVTNATYLNSCAPGSTWKLTTLFEAANLSATDIVTFCNATACMDPMHELLEDVPEGCAATVAGKTVELNAAVAEVHDLCHMTLHKSKGSHDDDDEDDHDHSAGATTTNSSATSNSSASSAVPSPAPTTKSAAASVPLAATLAVVSAASAIAALVL